MPDLTPARPTSGTPIESSWGQQVHDAIEGIQAGTTNAVFSSNNNVAVPVVFPRPYAVAPIVVATGDTAVSVAVVAKVAAVTTTGFTVQCQSTSGGSLSGTVKVGWIAIGSPA